MHFTKIITKGNKTQDTFKEQEISIHMFAYVFHLIKLSRSKIMLKVCGSISNIIKF